VECGLVIELDGESHYTPYAHLYDDPRTEYLEKQGLRVIRFENREIAENLDGVLETIRRWVKGDEKRSARDAGFES